MVKARRDGPFSDGGLVGWADYPTGPGAHRREAVRHQYQTYLDGGAFTTFHAYKSQLGIQSWMYSVLDSLLNVSSYQKLETFRFLTALMTAIVLSFFIAWFFEEFGLITACAVLICILYSMWITLFARNLWWVTGVFYIPVVSMLFLLSGHWPRHRYSNVDASLLVFFSISIKCLFNGYEFITTTLIMMVSPFIYYAAKCKWALSVLLKRLFIVGLACAAAIMLNLAMLIHQFSTIEGGYFRGLQYIYYRIVKRTYYFDESAEFGRGHSVDLASVLNDYANSLLMSFEWVANELVPFAASLSLRAWHIVGILVVVTLVANSILYRRGLDEQTRRKCVGLLATAWFSLLAPLSWLIIFKSHSANHLHMNHIIWHMPFALFSFAAFGLLIAGILPAIRRSEDNH